MLGPSSPSSSEDMTRLGRPRFVPRGAWAQRNANERKHELEVPRVEGMGQTLREDSAPADDGEVPSSISTSNKCDFGS